MIEKQESSEWFVRGMTAARSEARDHGRVEGFL
jgi:hypothetical protein